MIRLNLRIHIHANLRLSTERMNYIFVIDSYKEDIFTKILLQRDIFYLVH